MVLNAAGFYDHSECKHRVDLAPCIGMVLIVGVMQLMSKP